tara:strand:+ start:289 stop:426 length:138 start_codon:yes stop_codon:yes gene_type:complete
MAADFTGFYPLMTDLSLLEVKIALNLDQHFMIKNTTPAKKRVSSS